MKNPYASTCSVRGFEDFTWCYKNYSRILKKYIVCFQWLRWQGSEFCFECDSESQAKGYIKQLADHFNVDYTEYDRYEQLWTQTDWISEFETKAVTITPKHIRDILGDDIVIHVTYKTRETNILLREFEDIVDSFYYYGDGFESVIKDRETV